VCLEVRPGADQLDSTLQPQGSIIRVRSRC
jgi:hypothetical protein